MFLWIKAFHLIAVVTWFAALFYLPRLFVYHAMTDTTDTVGIARFSKSWKRSTQWHYDAVNDHCSCTRYLDGDVSCP